MQNINHGIILNLVSFDQVYVDDYSTFEIVKRFPKVKDFWDLSIKNYNNFQWEDVKYSLKGTAHSCWGEYGNIMIYNCFVKERIGKRYIVDADLFKSSITSIKKCWPSFINNFSNIPNVYLCKDYYSDFCISEVVTDIWPDVRLI